MRSVVNISLPEKLAGVVEKTVATGEFASKSEFFRHLLRLWIVKSELEKSRKELQKGRGKLLRSLSDLR
ncbi:MAG: type II toxin-antitoxin system ParD family antitoxin [Candidatus Paceibacterota bacterium]